MKPITTGLALDHFALNFARLWLAAEAIESLTDSAYRAAKGRDIEQKVARDAETFRMVPFMALDTLVHRFLSLIRSLTEAVPLDGVATALVEADGTIPTPFF